MSAGLLGSTDKTGLSAVSIYCEIQLEVSMPAPKVPLTRKDLFRCIAVETARMSYPGSMSRGKKPVVFKGTKKALEGYFNDAFPIENVWNDAPTIARDYDRWHKSRVDEIVTFIREHVSDHNVPCSVAAKFLNTFMHQLMKYEQGRPLFTCLQLPLDARVFRTLLRIKSPCITPLRDTFRNSPYALPYEQHAAVQLALWQFITELNARPNAGFKLTSRIDLNWLWL